MSSWKLAVTPVGGVCNTEKRGVAFLRGPEELTELNAATYFDSVSSESVGKRLRHRMGLWIAFVPDKKGKFHRFKDKAPKYRECFTFIDLEEKIRLYGYTCHPKVGDQRFELVLLITEVLKKEDLTDDTDLDRVLKWKDIPETLAAIRGAYPDKTKKPGGKVC